MAGRSWVGDIFRKWDDVAAHYKYHIIIGDVSGLLAFIYINTTARYSNLPQQLQGNQLPVSPEEFEFLDHESIIDCSTVQEIHKGEINEYLMENPGHHCGVVPSEKMQEITRIITYSKVVEIWVKEKYGFTPK